MSEADGNTGELRDIAYHIECLVAAVERIEKALLPKGGEREQIAFGLFVSQDELWPERCYELADRWITERDKQRAEAAANAQPPV